MQRLAVMEGTLVVGFVAYLWVSSSSAQYLPLPNYGLPTPQIPYFEIQQFGQPCTTSPSFQPTYNQPFTPTFAPPFIPWDNFEFSYPEDFTRMGPMPHFTLYLGFFPDENFLPSDFSRYDLPPPNEGLNIHFMSLAPETPYVPFSGVFDLVPIREEIPFNINQGLRPHQSVEQPRRSKSFFGGGRDLGSESTLTEPTQKRAIHPMGQLPPSNQQRFYPNQGLPQQITHGTPFDGSWSGPGVQPLYQMEPHPPQNALYLGGNDYEDFQRYPQNLGPFQQMGSFNGFHPHGDQAQSAFDKGPAFLIDQPHHLKSPPLGSIHQSKQGGDQSKLRIDIYYESMCQDSRAFVTKQLKSTVQKLDNHLEVHLEPWGKAQYNETTGKVKCQHGNNECYINRIHSCGIARLPKGAAQVNFVSCMFENFKIPADVGGQYCSQQSGLEWMDMQACATGSEGHMLNLGHGEQTRNANPPIRWVPTIFIDGERGDEDYQQLLVQYLFKEVCSLLRREKGVCPSECR